MLTHRAALIAPVCVLLLGASSPEGKKDAPKPPAGFVEVFVVGVIPGDDGNTVILTDQMRERFVPMGIGNTEALSIHTRLERRRFARPLTHDLFITVLAELGATLERIVVTEVHDHTFYAELHLDTAEGARIVSSRPSDAIALAVRCDAPLFASDELLDEVGQVPEPEPEEAEEGIIDEFKDFIDSVSPDDFAS